MLEKTLLTSVKMANRNELLIERFIKMKEYRQAWDKSSKLRGISFGIPKTEFTINHDSIINLIVSDINKNYLSVDKPDKKLSMVRIRVKATDQLFAKAFAETMVSNVNSFYVQTKTRGGIQNVILLQHQADSVRRVLNRSISGTAAALDIYPNANPALQSLRVPSRKKEVDVQAATAIYAEVIKNLEVARGMLQRETPLIQVIDSPVLPLNNDRVGKFKAMLTGIFVAVLVATLLIITIRVYRGIME
jgi:hypothetical protein